MINDKNAKYQLVQEIPTHENMQIIWGCVHYWVTPFCTWTSACLNNNVHFSSKLHAFHIQWTLNPPISIMLVFKSLETVIHISNWQILELTRHLTLTLVTKWLLSFLRLQSPAYVNYFITSNQINVERFSNSTNRSLLIFEKGLFEACGLWLSDKLKDEGLIVKCLLLPHCTLTLYIW